MRQKSEYFALRKRFQPDEPRLIFIAESPPASGAYIYDPEGTVTEHLFSAMMRAMTFEPDNKGEGLGEFMRRRLFLVDATYRPVNRLKGRARDNVILEGYGELVTDLRGNPGVERVPIVLIKANVRKILEVPLLEDGFRVINDGQAVYFPCCGRQGQFQQQLVHILRRHDIAL